MPEITDTLPATARPEPQANGVLPSHVLRELVRSGEIASSNPITEEQIQPASLDLRLGSVAYRVRASFLPGPNAGVADRIDQLGMHQIDLTEGAVLEKGCVYIVQLQERLRLSDRISGLANPKSSAGRLDIFTRLITDRAAAFERVPAGYEGALYVEIFPRAFSVIVRTGSRLNQLRLRRGSAAFSAAELKRLHAEVPLIDRDLPADAVTEGVPLSVDLVGEAGWDYAGYKARPHAGLIDFDRVGHYDPLEFWEPIPLGRGEGIILNPEDFYILASKEAVTIPPDCVAEMVAYDTLVGEFRVHYAGFFDPGFGHVESGGQGTRAVLEVRSHGVPFMIEDGQAIGRLIYNRLTDVPDKLYGAAIGSSYQKQGLALGKQFRRD
ncbi:MAG: 2'-deoxycytidine 5'-triphosphate deaminase [Alphaproteobacteria bacterium]